MRWKAVNELDTGEFQVYPVDPGDRVQVINSVCYSHFFFLFQICAFCVGISKSALSFDDSLEEPAWLRNAVFSVIVYYMKEYRLKSAKQIEETRCDLPAVLLVESYDGT